MSDQGQLLRERVARANREECRKAVTLCVTSGKGGVGKTCFSVNLALSFAQCGKKVVVIDGDFGFSNVNIMLGRNSRYSLEHVVRKEKRLSEVMEESYKNVWYISGGSGVSELIGLGGDQLEDIITQLTALERDMDYIIFDTGAGINDNILHMIAASDRTILVTTPEPTSVLDSYVVLKTASKLPEKPTIDMVVNKVMNEKEAVLTYQSFCGAADKHLGCNVGLIGYISADSRITKSISSMVPFIIQYPSSAAAMQFRKIANEMTNTVPEEKTGSNGIRSFFRRLIGKRDQV